MTGDEQPTAQLLLVLCGLPGVGKSTVAGYAAERLDAVRLRSDVVRKELFDDPDYDERETMAVYGELCDRASDHLGASKSVVLDATFARARYRQRAQTLASRHDVRFRLVRVVCDRPTATQRIATREDVSDADVAVYHELKAEFEPVETAHTVLDNSGSKAETRRQVETLLSDSLSDV
jgi:predicted kinase